MLGTGYFLKIARINFQQEKPICPDRQNSFPQNTKHRESEKFRVTRYSGARAREARVGQSPILMEYGQPLFVWLSRDWPSVRTYASTDCTGRVGETIKSKGGVSQACPGKSSSFKNDTQNMVDWQLSKQDSHWPVSHDHIAGSCVNSSRWRDLFGSCPLTSWSFY